MNENPIENSFLINQIDFLKNVLSLYADSSRYEGEEPTILKDKGHQAKFAIETVNKNMKSVSNDLLSEVEKTMEELERAEVSENRLREFTKKLEEMQKKYGN